MSIIIRLQHLPWSANATDIRQYFRNLSIPDGGVHIVGGENGDAFIAFGSDEDARQAMLLDGGKIRDTKIKLLLSSRNEMQKVIEQARQQALSMQSIMQMAAAASTLTAPVQQMPPLMPNAMNASSSPQFTQSAAVAKQLLQQPANAAAAATNAPHQMMQATKQPVQQPLTMTAPLMTSHLGQPAAATAAVQIAGLQPTATGVGVGSAAASMMIPGQFPLGHQIMLQQQQAQQMAAAAAAAAANSGNNNAAGNGNNNVIPTSMPQMFPNVPMAPPFGSKLPAGVAAAAETTSNAKDGKLEDDSVTASNRSPGTNNRRSATRSRSRSRSYERRRDRYGNSGNSGKYKDRSSRRRRDRSDSREYGKGGDRDRSRSRDRHYSGRGRSKERKSKDRGNKDRDPRVTKDRKMESGHGKSKDGSGESRESRFKPIPEAVNSNNGKNEGPTSSSFKMSFQPKSAANSGGGSTNAESNPKSTLETDTSKTATTVSQPQPSGAVPNNWLPPTMPLNWPPTMPWLSGMHNQQTAPADNTAGSGAVTSADKQQPSSDTNVSSASEKSESNQKTGDTAKPVAQQFVPAIGQLPSQLYMQTQLPPIYNQLPPVSSTVPLPQQLQIYTQQQLQAQQALQQQAQQQIQQQVQQQQQIQQQQQQVQQQIQQQQIQQLQQQMQQPVTSTTTTNNNTSAAYRPELLPPPMAQFFNSFPPPASSANSYAPYMTSQPSKTYGASAYADSADKLSSASTATGLQDRLSSSSSSSAAAAYSHNKDMSGGGTGQLSEKSSLSSAAFSSSSKIGAGSAATFPSSLYNSSNSGASSSNYTMSSSRPANDSSLTSSGNRLPFQQSSSLYNTAGRRGVNSSSSYNNNKSRNESFASRSRRTAYENNSYDEEYMNDNDENNDMVVDNYSSYRGRSSVAAGNDGPTKYDARPFSSTNSSYNNESSGYNSRSRFERPNNSSGATSDGKFDGGSRFGNYNSGRGSTRTGSRFGRFSDNNDDADAKQKEEKHENDDSTIKRSHPNDQQPPSSNYSSEKSAANRESGTCIELRNVSPNLSINEIRRFFTTIPMSGQCVKFVTDQQGRRLGSVYIRCFNQQYKNTALKMNGKLIRDTPVEICHLDDEKFDSCNAGKSAGTTGSSVVQESSSAVSDSRTIKISRLPKHTVKDDIYGLFPSFNKPSFVLLLADPRENHYDNNCVTAFIKFRNFSMVEATMENRSKIRINGQPANIEVCEESEFDAAYKQINSSAAATAETAATPTSNSGAATGSKPSSTPTEIPNKKSDTAKPAALVNDGESSSSAAPATNDNVGGTGGSAAKPSTETSSKFVIERHDCVSINGLTPDIATDNDMLEFFSGVDVVPTKIHIIFDQNGKPTGSAYCQFNSAEQATMAVSKHGTHHKDHLLQVELISRENMMKCIQPPAPLMDRPVTTRHNDEDRRHYQNNANASAGGPSRMKPSLMPPHHPYNMHARPSPYGSAQMQQSPQHQQRNNSAGNNGPPATGSAGSAVDFGRPGCVIGLKNVPYAAEAEEILDFFGNFNVRREDVLRRYDDRGRPTGDARVNLKSPADVQRALRQLNNKTIRKRTISLFPVR